MLSFEEFMKDMEPSLIRWRRHLHQYPELGFTEYRTTYYIGRELERLGFKLSVGREALESTARMGVPEKAYLQECERQAADAGVDRHWLELMEGGHTGLAAIWDTGKPGSHYAFRFDIDALPIDESEEAAHFPAREGFRSLVPGRMHACGHDGHAAIGLGLACFIRRFSEKLSGTFTLLFQPAEEGSRGALAMAEKGWLDSADYFMSGHIGIHSLEVGDFAAATTHFLASTKLDARFRGVSAHAGIEPHKGRNALLAAATASVQLAAIPRHADGATRVNVGLLKAGSGRNAVPDLAEMQLETRGETTELNEYMLEHTKRILEASARMHDVGMEMKEAGYAVEAACDDEWKEWARIACTEARRIRRVIPSLPLNGSEDAAFMINRVRQNGGLAAYFLFGTPLVNGHHHPEFDFDEGVLPAALEAICRLVLFLQERKGSCEQRSHS